MWGHFFAGILITVALLALMDRRETVNQTRYSVACDTKSDSARAFFDGLTKGIQ